VSPNKINCTNGPLNFRLEYKGATPTNAESVSSVIVEPGYRLDDQAIEVRSPAEARVFPLTSVSLPALGPTQPPVQWVLEVLSSGVKGGRGVTLTTHHIKYRDSE
jgi:hypothetical protein